MAESDPPHAAQAPSTEKKTIILHIISPSIQRITLRNLSTSTTVQELKSTISGVWPSRPSAAQQRLIHRGHAITRGDQTLKEIFTQELIEDSESLTLHLVLPPTPSVSLHPTSTPSSHIQTPGLTISSSQHSHGSPDAIPRRSRSQPGMPAIQRHSGVNEAAPPLPPQAGQPALTHGHPHPHMQQTFAQFHAINQQLAAQFAATQNASFAQGTPSAQFVLPNQAVQIHGQPLYSPPSFQHYLAQQHQAGLLGQPNGGHNTQQHIRNTHLGPNPANTNTIMREHVGPNGERWQTFTHTGHVNMNPFHAPNAAHGTAASQSSRSNTPRAGTPTNPTTNMASNATNTTTGSSQPSPIPQIQTQIPNNSFTNCYLALAQMETAVSSGQIIPENFMDAVRTFLNNSGPFSLEQVRHLWGRFNDIDWHNRQLRSNSTVNMLRAASERAASQQETHGADSSAVYVLSSPQGPQALLISPSGFYATQWQFPHMIPSINPPGPDPVLQIPSGIVPQAQLSTQTNAVPDPGPQQNAAQLVQPQVPGLRPNEAANVAGQQPEDQQANPARDFVRILIPLGGHLWLLIRLFGFVYFFTHGASWQRTAFLATIALVVFIGQTGVFRPLVQGVWDPIRRHADNLIPLAANDVPRGGNAGLRGARDAGAMGARDGNGAPTPQEVAERLLRERERQDANVLRQGLRRVERAVALFVASLIPGVGERHIAAREAAEAARQAEIREREERMRGEEEEARERQERENGAGENATSSGTDSLGGGPASGSSPTQERTPASQPPLIDV